MPWNLKRLVTLKFLYRLMPKGISCSLIFQLLYKQILILSIKIIACLILKSFKINKELVGLLFKVWLWFFMPIYKKFTYNFINFGFHSNFRKFTFHILGDHKRTPIWLRINTLMAPDNNMSISWIRGRL